MSARHYDQATLPDPETKTSGDSGGIIAILASQVQRSTEASLRSKVAPPPWSRQGKNLLKDGDKQDYSTANFRPPLVCGGHL